MRLVTLVAVQALSLAGAASAQSPEGSPPNRADAPSALTSLPDSPIGMVARGLIEAVNAGDTEVLRFVDAAASPELVSRPDVPGITAARYASALLKLREQSGGLELVTPMPGPGNDVRMLVQAKRGGHFLGIEIIPDPERPERFAYLGLHPMSHDPRKGSGLWNPEGETDDAALTAHVQRSVARLVAEDRFSGVVLLARGDSVLLEEAYGLANQAQRTPNTLRTRYHVGSIDKMFTAVAIAQLVEEGRLSFDDRLATVLPDYPNQEAARKITIRQLLTHTAGMGDPFQSRQYDARTRMDGPQSVWFPLFANQPLHFEPGARHEYSNGGYVVLGAVIEKLTGQPYHEYVRDHVFRAAGMTDTEPGPDGAIPNAAERYYRDGMADPLYIGTRIAKAEVAPGVGAAMGGSYLTARDLYRFTRALRSHRLLKPAMTDTVVSGKVPLGPGIPAKYAFGFYDLDMGSPVRGHSGGGTGSGIDADVEMLWDSDYTVVVVGNYDTPAARGVAQGMVQLILKTVASGKGGPGRAEAQ